MNTDQIFDVIIIGAGPAGLSASIFALERKLKCVVLEAREGGGQLTAFYPQKPVYDYPSYEQITGKELADKFVSHAKKEGANILTDTTVLSIEQKDGIFLVNSTNGIFKTKTVLIASGIKQSQPKKLGVQGETEFFSKGIYYSKLPQVSLEKKHVVVVGGGDTAMECAVNAKKQGAEVTLIHRKNEFKALEKTIDEAKNLDVKIIKPACVSVAAGDEWIKEIVTSQENGEQKKINTDCLVVCIGMEMNDSFLLNLGVKIEKSAISIDDNMQTSVKGVFACGDVCIPMGKYKRISIATGSAAIAVNGIYSYLKNLLND